MDELQISVGAILKHQRELVFTGGCIPRKEFPTSSMCESKCERELYDTVLKNLLKFKILWRRRQRFYKIYHPGTILQGQKWYLLIGLP
jgi:hypothetical protein